MNEGHGPESRDDDSAQYSQSAPQFHIIRYFLGQPAGLGQENADRHHYQPEPETEENSNDKPLGNPACGNGGQKGGYSRRARHQTSRYPQQQEIPKAEFLRMVMVMIMIVVVTVVMSIFMVMVVVVIMGMDML